MTGCGFSHSSRFGMGRGSIFVQFVSVFFRIHCAVPLKHGRKSISQSWSAEVALVCLSQTSRALYFRRGVVLSSFRVPVGSGCRNCRILPNSFTASSFPRIDRGCSSAFAARMLTSVIWRHPVIMRAHLFWAASRLALVEGAAWLE